MAEGGPRNPGQNPDEERRGGPGSGLPRDHEERPFADPDKDERIDNRLRRFMEAHRAGVAAGDVVTDRDREEAEELLDQERRKTEARGAYRRAIGPDLGEGGFWETRRGEGVGPEEPVEAARRAAQQRAEETPLPRPTAGRQGMDNAQSPGSAATEDAIDDAEARRAGESGAADSPSETHPYGPYHRVVEEPSGRTPGEAHAAVSDDDESMATEEPAPRSPRGAHEHQWRVQRHSREEAEALDQLRQAHEEDPLFDLTLHRLYGQRVMRGGPDPGDVRPSPRHDMSQLWMAGYVANTTTPQSAEQLLMMHEMGPVRNDIAEAQELLARVGRGEDAGVRPEELPHVLAEAEAVIDPARRAQSRERVLRTVYGEDYDRWLEQKAIQESGGGSQAEMLRQTEERARRRVVEFRGRLLEIEDNADPSDKSINTDHEYTYDQEGADLERLADDMRDAGLVDETEQYGLLVSRARNADEARLVEDVNKRLARVHALREEDPRPQRTYMQEQPERGTEDLEQLEHDLHEIMSQLDRDLARQTDDHERERVLARAGRELRALRGRAHDWVTVVNRPRESDVHGRGRGVTYDLVTVAPDGTAAQGVPEFRRELQLALARTESENRYRAAEPSGMEVVPTDRRGTSESDVGERLHDETGVRVDAEGRVHAPIVEGELLEGDNARPERWLEQLQGIMALSDPRERVRQLRALHEYTERVRLMTDHEVGLPRGARSNRAYAAFDEAFAEAAREMLPQEREPMALPIGPRGEKVRQERLAEARAGLAAELIPELSRVDTQQRMVPVEKKEEKKGQKGKKDDGPTEELEAIGAVIGRAQEELDAIIDRALDGGLIVDGGDDADADFPFEPVAGDVASQSFFEQARDMQALIDHLDLNPELAKQRTEALKRLEDALKQTQGTSSERQRREILAAIREGVDAGVLSLASPVTVTVERGEGPRSERILRQALGGRDGHSQPGAQEKLVRAAEEAAREHLLYLGDEQPAGDHRPAAKRPGLRAGQYPHAEAILQAELQQRVLAIDNDPQGEKGVADRSQKLLAQAMKRLEQIGAEDEQVAAGLATLEEERRSGGPVSTKADTGGSSGPDADGGDVDDGDTETKNDGGADANGDNAELDDDIESVTDNGAVYTELGERRRVAAARLRGEVAAARTRGQLDRVLLRAVRAGLLEDNMSQHGDSERRDVALRQRARPADNSVVSRGFYDTLVEQDEAIASYTALQHQVERAEASAGIEQSALDELKEVFREKQKPDPEEPIAWTADMVDNLARLSGDRRLIENLARQLIDAELILTSDAPQGSRRATITYAGHRVALQAIEDDEESERLMSIIRRELLSRTPPARNRPARQGGRSSRG